MKDFKWVWISMACLFAWIMILLWIDAVMVHAQEGGHGGYSDAAEEEAYYDSLELENRSWPGIYYFISNGWPEYETPRKKAGDRYFSR